MTPSSPAVRCLVVDDEPLARQILEKHVAAVPRLALAGSFQEPMKAFEFLQREPVDLLFLDVQMPTLTGIELLRSLARPPAVIFTTAYREYAVEGFELAATDYLLKPITFPRFLRAVDKFLDQQPEASGSETAGGHLYVNANKKHVKVAYADILYVESLKDYLRIVTTEQEVTTRGKISAFAKELPADFLRTHRSFIVNVRRVTAFTALDVEIGEREIPIGNSYKQQVWERLKR